MLTVLMATYDGASTLPFVLDAYARLATPDAGWRLVVVDNGSTDGTPELLTQHAARLPLRVLRQPVRGKNAALNLALETVLRDSPGADNDLFIFTDDDASPAADWLRQWETCGLAHPGDSVFGGAILPDWAALPPDWLLRLVPLGLTYGLIAPDMPDGPVFPGLIWGANMAVRRAAFAAGHRFDMSVGPNGSAYAMGSETELTLRLARAGYGARHCGAPRVMHHIRRQQMEPEYVLVKARRFGRGKYLQDRRGIFPEWLGVPRWMLRRYLIEWAGLLAATLGRNSDAAFLRRWELAYLQGYFHEARNTARHSAHRGNGAGNGTPANRKTVVVTSYSGELGGMELRMAQEVRFLQAHGYAGLLALRHFEGLPEWSQGLARSQIQTVEFDPPPIFEQWKGRRRNLWLAKAGAARRLLAFRAQLVHVAFCWTNYGASALWLASHCRLPAVISVHNAFPKADISAWHAPLMRQAFAAVRGVYAVSPSALAHFLAIYQPYVATGTRLAVIPNCVDVERFRPSEALRQAARTRLRLPSGALVVGTVARLSPQKQPGVTLALFALLRAQVGELYMVFIGDGPLASELRAQAVRMNLERYVIFTGYVAAVEEVLPALDLHLLLSRNEGFGIATIEAMACGIAAVATDVPGNADVLRGCAGGLLVPDGDMKAAVPQIAALLADSERRVEMGRLGRREVEQRYSEAVVGELVRDFYDGLV